MVVYQNRFEIRIVDSNKNNAVFLYSIDKTTMAKCLLICTIALCFVMSSLATHTPDRDSPDKTLYERFVSKYS